MPRTDPFVQKLSLLLALLFATSVSEACQWDQGAQAPACWEDCATSQNAGSKASATCTSLDVVAYDKRHPTDSSGWQYKDCAYSQGFNREAWCAGTGGTINSSGYCDQTTDRIWDSVNFADYGKALAAKAGYIDYIWFRTPPNSAQVGCSPPILTRPGFWGDGTTNGFCFGAPGASQNVNGIPVQDVISTQYTFNVRQASAPTCANATPLVVSFDTQRNRSVKCPAGYDRRTAFDGKIQCWKLGIEPCGFSHHVSAANGQEMISELDLTYGSIQVEREFNSLGGIGYDGQLGWGNYWVSHAKLWRSSFERRLAVLPGTTTGAAFVAIRPNGAIEHFLSDGTQMSPKAGASWHVDTDTTEPGSSWRLRLSDDSVEYYDANGRFLKWAAKNGKQFTLTYIDGQLGPDHVTDEHGRTLWFHLDSDGRIASISDDSTTLVTYVYDSFRRLVTVRYANGKGVLYFYESPQFLEAVTGVAYLADAQDTTGTRYITYSYDSSGRLVDERLAPGTLGDTAGHYHLEFNTPSAGITRVTTPSGKKVDQGFSRVNGALRSVSSTVNQPMCGSDVASTSYDAAGRVSSMTDFAGTVGTRTINERGLETLRVDAASASTSNSPSAKRTIQTDWHPSFNMPVERRVYNADNALESRSAWAYNARGQIVAACRYDTTNTSVSVYVCGSQTDAPTGVRQTTTSYCEAADVAAAGSTCPILGNVKAVDGPRNNADEVRDITKYSYRPEDATCTDANACFRKGDLWKITSALGQSTEFVSHDAAGRVTRMKDANDVITDTTYDLRGWMTSRTIRAMADGSPSASDNVTSFLHDATGQVVRVTQSDQSYVRFTYDNAKRLTDIKDSMGNSLHYELDAEGHRKSDVTKDASGTVRRTLSRLYDDLGRLQSVLNASGQTLSSATYDANGKLDIVTDANGVVSNNDYDPLGRLISTIRDEGSGRINAATGYRFDTRGNVTGVTDPNHLDTSYEYDGIDNLVKLTSHDTGVTTYEYDNAGNRISHTDARGIKAIQRFDEVNRIVSIVYPDTSLNVSYFYDQPNSATGCSQSYPKGRMTSMADASGTTTWCYDFMGNIIQKTQMSASGEHTIGWTYDTANRVQSIRYSDDFEVTYGRDLAGRIATVGYSFSPGDVPTPLITAVEYLPFGPVATITFADGHTLKKRYDSNYIIDNIESSLKEGLKLDFGTDLLGNIVDASSTIGGSVPMETYVLDNLYRLRSGTPSGSTTPQFNYVYDATGDRQSSTVNGATTPYVYSPSSHALIGVGPESRSYDDNGNLVMRSTTTSIRLARYTSYSYDDSNRLQSFASQLKGGPVGNGVSEVFALNGRGEQIDRMAVSGRLASQTIDTLVFGAPGQVLSEFVLTEAGSVNQNQSRTDIVWMDGTPVAIMRDGLLHYVETDHLGTPRVLIDSVNGARTWFWRYLSNPFGETPPDSYADSNGTIGEFNLRFPGQVFDPTSGLAYNYFRDYEATTGRYTQSDPIGLKGGMSTYSYVRNSPLRRVDPLGLMEWTGNGTFTAYTVEGVGAAFDYYEVKSTCGPNGKRASASFFGTGISLSYGPPATLSTSPVTFVDGSQTANINVFEGYYYRDGGALALSPLDSKPSPNPFPNSYGQISAGGAKSDYSLGSEDGLDIGISTVDGYSHVIGGSYECCTPIKVPWNWTPESTGF